MLRAAEAFLLLRRLVNPDPVKASGPGLRYPTYVDYLVADSPLEAYRDHLRSGDYYVRTVTLKDPPAQTWPLILKRLYELPANYHLVTEWHPLGPDEARKIITRARRHHHTQKTSVVSHLSDEPEPPGHARRREQGRSRRAASTRRSPTWR